MSQTWDPLLYARAARFVSDFGEALIALLDPKPGERILDLGCGDGVLTAKLLATGAHVVGVDASAAMVRAAQQRGIDARLMRGEDLTFEAEFDAVFSNAALHWMKPPTSVVGGIRRALKPGGRLVLEMGGAGNNASLLEDLNPLLRERGLDGPALSPWYFPTADEYCGLLRDNGLIVDLAELFPRPTPLPGDITDWFDSFCGAFLAAIPERDRQAFKDELARRLAPGLKDDQGRWTMDYVRLRVLAHLPSEFPAGHGLP
jgi:trans-aconitate methyltransferase